MSPTGFSDTDLCRPCLGPEIPRSRICVQEPNAARPMIPLIRVAAEVVGTPRRLHVQGDANPFKIEESQRIALTHCAHVRKPTSRATRAFRCCPMCFANRRPACKGNFPDISSSRVRGARKTASNRALELSRSSVISSSKSSMARYTAIAALLLLSTVLAATAAGDTP